MEMNKSYPQVICEELKKYVKGQDEYCKQLSIIGYFHNLKCLGLIDQKIKSNLLVVGPSGCGKTYGVEVLAKLLDCHYQKIDCSSITAAGYKGSDIAKVIVNLEIDDDKGTIVFFDEIDKVYDPYQEGKRSATKVYEEFLKLMEDEIYIYEDNQIDLSKVTFIFAGAFLNLSQKKSKENLFAHSDEDLMLTAEDFVRYEKIPVEFMGRIDRVISLRPLTKELYKEIIFHAKDSLYQKFETLLNKSHCELIVSQEVKDHLLDVASTSPFGVRGVNCQIKEMINEFLYQNESMIEIHSFVISYHQTENRYIYNAVKKPVVIEEDELISDEYEDAADVNELIDFLKKEIIIQNPLERKMNEGVNILIDYHLDIINSLKETCCKTSLWLFKRFVRDGISRSLFNIEDAFDIELEDSDYKKALETKKSLEAYGGEETVKQEVMKMIEKYEDMEEIINE